MTPSDRHRHSKSDSRQTRSRSPRRDGRERPHRTRSHSREHRPVNLPFGARPLTKHDLTEYRAMFGLYLDIQKRKDIEELSNDELKGRWKSFVNKWNRKELSEGWYDPATKQRADASAHEPAARRPSPPARPTAHEENKESHESDDEDDYGPSLPSQQLAANRVGPMVPRLQDLQHRNELAREDEEARREDLRYERKAERLLQKERLDELVPRAEAGTRERRLEKKREIGAANRSFREAKSPGAEEVGEKDLLGDDGVDAYKAQVRANEKRKSERELRKEEVLRAREAEREERLAEHRAKEQKTMEMLQALAKQRFG
ncbi:hypothetical protein M8818_007763 [Zalaria obscura]|uniref:Uncharacterized protein n=1 Tax=Zalaria obscura TaxID=2024903 RepID=A0ACC3S696_9PEZI